MGDVLYLRQRGGNRGIQKERRRMMQGGCRRDACLGASETLVTFGKHDMRDLLSEYYKNFNQITDVMTVRTKPSAILIRDRAPLVAFPRHPIPPRLGARRYIVT